MDVSCKVGVSLYRCGREWTTFTIGVHVMSDGDAVTVQRRICCLVYLCMGNTSTQDKKKLRAEAIPLNYGYIRRRYVPCEGHSKVFISSLWMC